jgi:hypothetical protein
MLTDFGKWFISLLSSPPQRRGKGRARHLRHGRRRAPAVSRPTVDYVQGDWVPRALFPFLDARFGFSLAETRLLGLGFLFFPPLRSPIRHRQPTSRHPTRCHPTSRRQLIYHRHPTCRRFRRSRLPHPRVHLRHRVNRRLPHLRVGGSLFSLNGVRM